MEDVCYTLEVCYTPIWSDNSSILHSRSAMLVGNHQDSLYEAVSRASEFFNISYAEIKEINFCNDKMKTRFNADFCCWEITEIKE